MKRKKGEFRAIRLLQDKMCGERHYVSRIININMSEFLLMYVL